VNDNCPEFSQNIHYGSVNQIYTDLTYQKIIQFEVNDPDSGRYGLDGLVCYLLGDQNDMYTIFLIILFIYLFLNI